MLPSTSISALLGWGVGRTVGISGCNMSFHRKQIISFHYPGQSGCPGMGPSVKPGSRALAWVTWKGFAGSEPGKTWGWSTCGLHGAPKAETNSRRRAQLSWETTKAGPHGWAPDYGSLKSQLNPLVQLQVSAIPFLLKPVGLGFLSCVIDMHFVVLHCLWDEVQIL